MANKALIGPLVRPRHAEVDLPLNRQIRGRFVRGGAKSGYYAIAFGGLIFLWLPIVLLVVFSFNDSRAVNQWQGFTGEWYSNIFNNIAGTEARFSTELMLHAVSNSLFVSITAGIIATGIGTLVALSLARGTYPGKKLLDGLLFIPLVIPEITQGVSLAMFFMIAFAFLGDVLGIQTNYGFGTIIIGHVAFNISYVAVVVRARLAHMNPRLEEAAHDLGANGWRTFWYITFPQILPGIIAGWLLAFTLSLDDYVVTFFNNGIGTTTLPIFVYGMLKTSVTPEINALSTLMLVASTILVVISLGMQSQFSRR